MKKLILLLIIVSLLFSGAACSWNELGFPETADKLNVSSNDFLYDIANGDVDGSYPWGIFGYNPNIGTTKEALWEYSTAYTFPTAPLQMEIFSSSAQDAPGGTGALTVIIEFLDSAYIPHTEILTMNGATPVPTASSDIFRINGMYVGSVGSSGTSQGNITLQTFGGGTVYSYLIAGRNSASNLVYTVPVGFTLRIVSMGVSTADATKGVNIAFESNSNVCHGSGERIDYFMSCLQLLLYNNSHVTNLPIPMTLVATTDIKVTVVSGQAGASSIGAILGWLEET